MKTKNGFELKSFGVPELISNRRGNPAKDFIVPKKDKSLHHYLWEKAPDLSANPEKEKRDLALIKQEQEARRTQYQEKVDEQKRYADVELEKLNRPKILMLSATSPFDRYRFQRVVTDPFKKLYCRRWWLSYIYIEYNRSPLARHPYWDRIYYIKKYLGSYDYVWWLDADAAPVEMGTDVYQKYIKDREWDILIGNENFSENPNEVYFNTGCMIFKNCLSVIRFLQEWGSSWVYDKFKGTSCPEQDAFNFLYKRGNPRNDIRIEYEGVGRFQDWGAGFEVSNWVPGCLVHHTPSFGRPGGKYSGNKFREFFWGGLDKNVLLEEGLSM